MDRDLIITAVGSLLAGMVIWNWWIYGRHHRRTHYPADWDDLRRAIYKREGYICQNCRKGDRQMHAHHIVPLGAGGTNELTNLGCLCQECHKLIHAHMR